MDIGRHNTALKNNLLVCGAVQATIATCLSFANQ